MFRRAPPTNRNIENTNKEVFNMEELNMYFNTAISGDNLSPGMFVKNKDYRFINSLNNERKANIRITFEAFPDDGYGYVLSRKNDTGVGYEELGMHKNILLAINNNGQILTKMYDSRLFQQVDTNELQRVSKILMEFSNDESIAGQNIKSGAFVRPRSHTKLPPFILNQVFGTKADFITPLIVIAMNDDNVDVAGYTKSGAIHEIQINRHMLCLA